MQDCKFTSADDLKVNSDLYLLVESLYKDGTKCNVDKQKLRDWMSDMDKRGK